VGDGGGLPGIAGDFGGLRGTMYESYRPRFLTPSPSRYRNSSNNIQRKRMLSGRDRLVYNFSRDLQQKQGNQAELLIYSMVELTLT